MLKLPFWATVGAAYRFVFGNAGDVFRTGAVWILGSAALETAYLLASVSAAAGIFVAILLAVFSYAGTVAFAVAWHRNVLTGERRHWLEALRFRGREWRFLFYGWGYAAIFALIVAIIILVLLQVALKMMPHAPDPDRVWTVLAIYGAIAIIAGFFVLMPVSRLALGFPAIAIEEPKGVWSRSWRRGKGNSARLTFGIALSGLLLVATNLILVEGQNHFALAERRGEADLIGHVAEIVGPLVLYAIRYFAFAIEISFLSLSYRRLAAAETAGPVAA